MGIAAGSSEQSLDHIRHAEERVRVERTNDLPGKVHGRRPGREGDETGGVGSIKEKGTSEP